MFVYVDPSIPALRYTLYTYLTRIGYPCATSEHQPLNQPSIHINNHLATLELVYHDGSPRPPHDTYISTTITIPFTLHYLALRLTQFISKLTLDSCETLTLHPSYIFNLRERTLTNTASNLSVFLTEKEAELLAYLHLHQHTYASRDILLAHVWKYHSDVDTHTLETHMYRLRQKLAETGGFLEIIHEQHGYKLQPTP